MSQDTLSLPSKAYNPSRWWRKFRVVADNRYGGYRAQVRYLWLWWIEYDMGSHISVEDAENYIINQTKVNDTPRYKLIKHI